MIDCNPPHAYTHPNTHNQNSYKKKKTKNFYEKLDIIHCELCALFINKGYEKKRCIFFYCAFLCSLRRLEQHVIPNTTQ